MKKTKHRYQVGTIIADVKSGKLEILEQIRIKTGKYTEKEYKYKCLICGNIDTIRERSILNKNGCNVCSNQKILIGYNDMWTTNPEQAKSLLNKEDGYKYTQCSGQKVDWKCPDCGEVIKNKRIYMINKYGLSCPKCGDGISYPEKFMYSTLQQLNIDFIYQLTKKDFEWCDKYKYDFYFKLNNENYIIETHGLGHYEKSFNKCGGRTLKEEQENDKTKKELALRNGIKEENYIVIDCRHSILEWIKEHIINSQLNNLLDLSKINWLECHKFACNSLVKKACELWSDGIYNTNKISKILKLGQNTIIRYLKQGVKLGWCNYNPKISYKLNKEKHNTKVICLNNKKIFNSIKECSEYYSIPKSGIGKCCKNKQNSCGMNLNTKKYLQWQYYDEYLIEPKKLLTNDEIDDLNNNYKKVICLNNKKVFNSIKEAMKYYNIERYNSIGESCREERKSAGKDFKTGEELKWKYYDKNKEK